MALKKVNKAYGSRTIYGELDFMVRRKERWCIMGVNGAGKSTLLKLVTGTTEPDSGNVTLGASVKLGYFAQHAMDVLDGDSTILEWLEERFPKAGQAPLRALSGCFGFSGDDVEKRCRVLSGGEKARLVMAAMLFDPPNFLVLDEPTNHLDLDTKEMLIKALSDYEGTMLFVSHDRHFLAALSNRVLELTRMVFTNLAAATRNMSKAPGRKHRAFAAEETYQTHGLRNGNFRTRYWRSRCGSWFTAPSPMTGSSLTPPPGRACGYNIAKRACRLKRWPWRREPMRSAPS